MKYQNGLSQNGIRAVVPERPESEASARGARRPEHAGPQNSLPHLWSSRAKRLKGSLIIWSLRGCRLKKVFFLEGVFSL